jgi:hypothetical protein
MAEKDSGTLLTSSGVRMHMTGEMDRPDEFDWDSMTRSKRINYLLAGYALIGGGVLVLLVWFTLLTSAADTTTTFALQSLAVALGAGGYIVEGMLQIREPERLHRTSENRVRLRWVGYTVLMNCGILGPVIVSMLR